MRENWDGSGCKALSTAGSLSVLGGLGSVGDVSSAIFVVFSQPFKVYLAFLRRPKARCSLNFESCENRCYTDSSRWTKCMLWGRSHTRQICTPLTNSQIKSVVTAVQNFSYCAAETGMTGCRLPTSSKPMRSWRCGGLAICAALTPSLKAGRVLISDVKARLMVRHHSDDAGSWQHRSRILVEQVGGGDL